MELIWLIIFILGSFVIFWAMIGYPLSLRIIDRFTRNHDMEKDYNYEPTVTVMIVAHNEEDVIYDKLINVTRVDYPRNKLEILVSSDNSTDRTNEIVQEFIKSSSDFRIRLYKVKERKGKTNAQNEAAATVTSEILVMTDANAMLDSKSIRELVSSFCSKEIAYVTGRLSYMNADAGYTSESESRYWQWDLKMREVESRLHSVTAGNGALYACRAKDYYNFEPILSHDSAMPKHYVLQGKRAIYNKDAVAYEKAGENVKDEFGRKVRMSRDILTSLFPDIRIFNVIRYGWFSYCYFGHRFCRNNLWLAHLVLLVSNIVLAYSKGTIFTLFLVFQLVFYFIAFAKHDMEINSKIANMAYYYTITIVAQLVGAYRQITGKAKPFWEKAESTR